MFLPLFGFLSDLSAELRELGNNLLLVLGGFLLGYLLGGVIAWSLGRWALRQKNTEVAQRIGRPLGGTIVALIVALIVFTGKGKAPGDGGDGKGAPGADSTPGKTSTQHSEPAPKINPNISTRPLEHTGAETTIRVTVLAGAAVPAEGRFYVLNNDSRDQARTLSDLKRAIEDERARNKGRLALAIVFPTDPNYSPPRNDKKVTDLTRWATEDAGLDVTFPSSR
jgi:hypothetical protein